MSSKKDTIDLPSPVELIDRVNDLRNVIRLLQKLLRRSEKKCYQNKCLREANSILFAIHQFFRQDKGVYPSALILNDDRTIGQAVADYIAKAKAEATDG